MTSFTVIELSSNIPLLMCLLYLAMSLVIGVLPGLKNYDRQVGHFVAADGNMGTLLLFFVLGASIYSSVAFLGIPSMAYSQGAAAYTIIAAGIIGAVPFFFLGPAVRKAGLTRNFITQGDFFSWRYNSAFLSILLAVFALIVSIPYLVFQIKGAGLILETISGGSIPFWLGASLTYSIVGIYVIVSGVRGVGWTNAVQGLFMALVAIFIGLYFPITQHGGVGEMFTKIAESDSASRLWGPGLTSGGNNQATWLEFSSTVVVIAAGFTCWPHLFIKCFAARSQQSLRKMAMLYPLYVLLIIPLIFVGYSALMSNITISSADALVPSLLVDSALPVVVVGALACAILAASMSSGDTILHAAGSIVVHDGLKRAHLVPQNREMLLIRLIIILLLTICFIFALTTNQSIVQLYLASYALVAQILPATVAAVYWKQSTTNGVIVGLVSGIAVSVFFFLYPGIKPIPVHEGVYGLVTNICLLVITSLLFPNSGVTSRNTLSESVVKPESA